MEGAMCETVKEMMGVEYSDEDIVVGLLMLACGEGLEEGVWGGW